MNYVYVAKSGHFVKIGHSLAPRQRVRALMNQKDIPALTEPLEVVHATTGSCDLERHLHSAAESYRLHGREFFSIECLEVPEIKDFLATPPTLGPERYSCSLWRPKDARLEAVAARMRAKGRRAWLPKRKRTA